MAFSGLYGLTRNCAHEAGKPASRVGVSVAAILDVIASVAMAILIVFGSKMGLHIPSMGQYGLGIAALLNIVLLLNKNIVPGTENFRSAPANSAPANSAPANSAPANSAPANTAPAFGLPPPFTASRNYHYYYQNPLHRQPAPQGDEPGRAPASAAFVQDDLPED